MSAFTNLNPKLLSTFAQQALEAESNRLADTLGVSDLEIWGAVLSCEMDDPVIIPSNGAPVAVTDVFSEGSQGDLSDFILPDGTRLAAKEAFSAMDTCFELLLNDVFSLKVKRIVAFSDEGCEHND